MMKGFLAFIGGSMCLVSVILAGAGALTYLQDGYWHVHTFLEFTEMPANNTHTDWVGLWDIAYTLLGFPISFVFSVLGYWLFARNE
jgi:hypothetical protein